MVSRKEGQYYDVKSAQKKPGCRSRKLWKLPPM